MEDYDGPNKYMFVRNNPLYYTDPDGRFVLVFLIPLAAGGLEAFAASLTIQAVIGACLEGAALYAAYQAADKLDTIVNNAIEEKKKKGRQTTIDVYAPDRPLPSTPDGVHIPDSEKDHTQLGMEEGRKGKYPQAREFKNGKPF